jgi:hypothetical protein
VGLFNLKKWAEDTARGVGNVASGVARQVNPFDGGKTYSNPAPAPRPAQTFQPAPMQKINLANGGRIDQQFVPQSQAMAGNELRMRTQSQLGWTPKFTENVFNANPFVAKAPKGVFQASGYFLGNKKPNQISVHPRAAESYEGEDTLTHEGLHRVWETNQQERHRFAEAYNRSATPELREYLKMRSGGYSNSGLGSGIDRADFSRFETLPHDVQDEVHSHVPGYYSQLQPINAHRNPRAYKTMQDIGIISRTQRQGDIPRMPDDLANYYKQYFNPYAQVNLKRKPRMLGDE